MQRYENYKPSGAEWLGDIPAHWTVTPAKRLFSEVSEKNHPDAELLSVTQEFGVVPRSQLEQRVVMPTGQLQTFKLVRIDDFVISLRSFQGGIEYSEFTGLVSPAYTILRKQKKANSRYLKHLLKSAPFISELNTSVTGIREGKNISFSEMAYSLLPLPPRDEQDRIVAFLDQKTAEIDVAIAKKERLIELLGEQTDLLVSRAVLTGLNPEASKNSCEIDGIDSIPSHWKVVANRRLFKEKAKKYKGEALPPLSLSQKDGLIPTNEMQERSLKTSSYEHFRICRAGDLVLNRFKAHLGVFFAAKQDGVVTFHYGIYTPEQGVSSKYFELLFHTGAFRAIYAGASNGMTIGLQNLSNQNFYDVKSIVPPLNEQVDIVNYVIDLESRYATLILFIDKELTSLRELKKLTIANTVTGQIKV